MNASTAGDSAAASSRTVGGRRVTAGRGRRGGFSDPANFLHQVSPSKRILKFFLGFQIPPHLVTPKLTNSLNCPYSMIAVPCSFTYSSLKIVAVPAESKMK